MALDSQATKGPTPPYVAYRTFSNFVEGLRQGMPGRIDRSVMGTLSGAVQAQLIATLRYLGLVSDDGTPTDRLARLVHSEGSERESALRDILTTSYPSLFDDAGSFHLATATADQFQEQFRKLNIRGDTVRKAQAFFLAAAKEANVPLSRFLAAKNPSNTVQRTPRTRSSSPHRTSRRTPDAPPLSSREAPTPAVSWEQMLLSKFPSFDPAWSPEVQSKWFDAFDRLMRQGQDPAPLNEEPE
jgi:hypothetical protein